jgi:spore germination protein (amino acid permease)
MSEEKAIMNNKQFRDIIICVTWPTIINYGSGFLAREVGRDMWISGIISILTTLPLILITIYIGQQFPGKTVVEYSRNLLGTIPGKLLGFVLSIYFLLVSVNSVSMYIHHLTAFLLPQTPFPIVTVLHIFVVCYFIWKGPEVIARTGVIGFALAIVFYLLVFLASLAEINIDRIMPFFDSGVIPVFKASLKADTFVGVDHILIAMILPMVVDQKNALRSSVAGLSIGGFFFVFYFIVELMVMGPQIVALMRIASMDFVRSIQITQYLHRFESFMVALWYWSILVQAGILGSCSLQAFMETYEIKKKTPGIIIAFGVTTLILTYLIAYDRVFFLNFREYIWQYFALPIQFGIPLILFLTLGIKRIRKN